MLLAVSFVATFALILSAGLLLFYRDAVLDRLESLIDPAAGSTWSRLTGLLRRKPGSVENIVKPFQNLLPRSTQEVSVVQKRLIRAGYRESSAVNVFYSAKVIVPIILSVIVTVSGAYEIGPLFMYG